MEEPALQCKLTVSQPDDPFELEADRVADEVIRIAEPSGRDVATSARTNPGVQRQVDGASDETVEWENEDDEVTADETGMPKRRQGASSDAATSIRVPRGGGSALEPTVRDFMEERFGDDFSPVRVHTDAAASASADRLDALAYTVGRDIYFREGQYSPASLEGRRLLAHELTHVLQQTGFDSGPAAPRQARLKRQRPHRRVRCHGTCGPGNCPQGKQPRVVRDDCARGRPRNEDNYISALHVSLSDRTVKVIWSAMVPGNVEIWPCSPNPTDTPLRSAEHPDTVGKKCSINHTNLDRDGMAWFTGFASENLRIGFHDSQPVGPGCVSHGCVRVCCDKARIINENTWSGRTVITVE